MKAVLAFTTLLTLSTANAAVQSWPQFRGPNSSGVAEAAKAPVEFGPNTNLLLKTELPPGVSSPCVWGDRIFLTAAQDGKLLTLAVNRQDGKVLWRQAVEGGKPREIHRDNHPAAAPPAPHGPDVCVYHATFGLIGFDF